MNLLPTIGLLCLFLLVGSFAIALVFRRTKRYVFNAESKYKARSGELGINTHDTPTAVDHASEVKDFKGQRPLQYDTEVRGVTVVHMDENGHIVRINTGPCTEVHIAFVPPSELKPVPTLVDKWIKVLCNKEGLDASAIVLHVTNANSRPSGKLRVKEIVHHKNFRELGLSDIEGLKFVEIKVDGYKPRVQAKQATISLNWILDKEQAKETVSHVSEVIGSFEEYLGSKYRKSLYREKMSGPATIQERLNDVSEADQANFDHFVGQSGIPFRLTYGILPGGMLAKGGTFVHPA